MRADWEPGTARGQYDRVHRRPYDIEVDTSVETPVAAATRIRARLEAGPVPSAWEAAGATPSAGFGGGAAVARRARPDDAPAMGRIHVRAWQAAYAGVMPDAYLDGLSPDERTDMWGRSIAQPGPGHVILVVDDGTGVQGFAALGPQDADPYQTEIGQLYAVNVDPAAWGRGLGRRLMAGGMAVLRAQGYRRAVLWVLPENRRARDLYESEGWAADGAERDDDVVGVQVKDIRYRVALI